MKSILWVVFLLVSLISAGDYDSFFTDAALRIDLYHSGTADEEKYTVAQLYRLDAWAGSRLNLIDTLNLGFYLLRVYDSRTNQMIFSRGYGSLFKEWQTTSEALEGGWQIMEETLLMPFPRNAVYLEISKRDEFNTFTVPLFSMQIDPRSTFINTEKRFGAAEKIPIFDNGNPTSKVDLAIVSEGYQVGEKSLFENDMRKLVDTLFTISPFRENKNKFNVSGVFIPSVDSGTDAPHRNSYRNTVLNSGFNSLNIARYLMTNSVHALHDAASVIAYDALYILVNTFEYGGGAIFNFYSCSAARNKFSPYVFVHEFGHGFAGLGDEYYTSQVSYNDFYSPGTEPWEPNITALLIPEEIKWQRFVSPGIPVPTPWQKDEFDTRLKQYANHIAEMYRENASAEEIKKVQDKHEQWVNSFFASHPQRNKVGAFEGAGYISLGLYRPALNCIMFSKDLEGFDPVCATAIERMINFIAP